MDRKAQAPPRRKSGGNIGALGNTIMTVFNVSYPKPQALLNQPWRGFFRSVGSRVASLLDGPSPRTVSDSWDLGIAGLIECGVFDRLGKFRVEVPGY